MSTREERTRTVFKAINDGMAAAERADWTKDSPEISTAEASLNEAMTLYIEGETTLVNVRGVYQTWRDLHKVGGVS